MYQGVHAQKKKQFLVGKKFQANANEDLIANKKISFKERQNEL
jgi:hypothetical protein